ncbi:hypothetical protein [Sulfuriferula multivorans]|uniref:hypothetical protein n=1 Tax=Sulfuriferula multivorans TaxID=1559896 RepID=UPI000F5BAC9F|nr:hypothetical protein [Sulfuriferula multivorans]
MSNFELLSVLIATLAAIISFVSLYRTHRTAEQQIALQKVQSDLANLQHIVLVNELKERQHADLRVTFAEEGQRQLLVFENRGPAPAQDVEFELLVKAGEHNPLIYDVFNSLFPIKVLRPDESVSMLIAANLDTNFPLTGKMSWKNSAGESQEQECQISL